MPILIDCVGEKRMLLRGCHIAVAGIVMLGIYEPTALLALDPSKALTQYTRTVWTEAEGLPQDTIRAIAQTSDGYLWLGTTEGLARFDGYDFVTFSRDKGNLPNDSVTSLLAGRDGSLWIGTLGGLARYADGRFTTYTTENGLRSTSIISIVEDKAGVLWMVGTGVLSRFANGKFTAYPKESLAPLESARVVYQDDQQQIWVAGVGGLVKRIGDKFVPVLTAKDLDGNIITAVLKGGAGLWLAGIKGLFLLQPDGRLKRFTTKDGLPDNVVRALYQDHAGNLWAGTLGGLSRLQNGHFVGGDHEEKGDKDWVWSLFEDREGDLWAGMNSSLIRFRDDVFSVYGRSESLPSDEPVVVHQDAGGRIWVGYHDNGLISLGPGKRQAFTVRDGLPSNQVFGIRDAANGDLLVATFGGLSRRHNGRLINYSVPDPFGRTVVFDAVEDSRKHIWAATANGVYEFDGETWHMVVRAGKDSDGYTVTLTKTSDGSIWAGTLSKGLWRVTDGRDNAAKPRLYTTADGLGSNQIRSIYEDADGTLYIGTFSGGLTTLRDGVFRSYRAGDGLLSDNISHIEDDGKGSLWLSTTRGICRLAKQQLKDFDAGRIHILTPRNYGLADGLRSTQCAPAYPAGGGGTRTSDGRLWFPTGRGLAVIDPDKTDRIPKSVSTPITHIVETAVDGAIVDLRLDAKLKPGTGRVQFRYSGIYLTAPERVQFFYKLEGLDRDWIPAGNRRLINYNPLPHGRYRFAVRSALPDGIANEDLLAFEVLPHIYETRWFLWLCILSILGLIYGAYNLRLKQIHSRFQLISEERARLGREIHDTLAQGFVGICHQLDALANKLGGDPQVTRQHLNLARKMARHSLTEARRSVMDLRMSELETQDLPTALSTSAAQWVPDSRIDVNVSALAFEERLPNDVEQNLLRIAQEAVANAVKHANPKTISVHLEKEGRFLLLRVKDDGQGFEPSGSMSLAGGHFGILGMRERAERLGGELTLASHPGGGTQVEVKVPLATRRHRHN